VATTGGRGPWQSLPRRAAGAYVGGCCCSQCSSSGCWPCASWPNSSGELLSAADDLTRVSPGWLAAAAAAEVLSYAALGAAQRRLLAAGGVRVGLIPITALGVAAQAGANCLPGGVAVSTVISFRRLNRRGVQPFLCGWMLSVSTLLYATVLALLALLGPSSPARPPRRYRTCAR